jgi:precorrin-6A synthase
MRRILVVGIGTGNPDHITMQAIRALNGADVLFIPRKGADKADLAELRRETVARHVASAGRTVEFDLPVRDARNPSYAEGVGDWHDAIARLYVRLIGEELPEGGTGAFLVWGDPSLYDSTLRILSRVRALGLALEVTVIPGVSSLHALTAAHGIALNRIGEPVLLTTGRRLAESPPDGDAVVMLDGRLAFRSLDGDAYDIYWGAYLGTENELLVHGRLGAVAAEIEEKRAAARLRHGWIMDTYLLRQRGGDPSDDSGGAGD